MADGSGENFSALNDLNGEVCLQEDSENDVESDQELCGDLLEEAYELIFDSSDDVSDFEGFQLSSEESDTDSIGDEAENESEHIATKKKKKQKEKDCPEGYKMSSWSYGDTTLTDIPFTANPGFNVDIPDDANELYFLELFLTD